jgi:hypothetical protein
MKTIFIYHDRLLKVMRVVFGVLFLMCWISVADAAKTPDVSNADRAVEIAKKSREKVERSGKMLQSSSNDLFKAFAESTVELQKLMDAREQLDQAGFLSKDDPEGKARRAHINAKILTEVGQLKLICDQNLDNLLQSLDSFDRAVADSVVDTQATRSINSNYELALNRYLKQERKSFDQTMKNAEEALAAYQDSTDPAEKKQLKKKYDRIKKRMVKIAQRRKLFESRIKVAQMNQQITGLIRDKIRQDGAEIPEKFRSVMSGLYTLFAKIVPVAEAGGTGSPDYLANMGFSNLTELNNTLGVVESSIAKLDGVLDNMVNDVLNGFDGIQIVDETGMTGAALSVEDEMDFIYSQRDQWNN